MPNRKPPRTDNSANPPKPDPTIDELVARADRLNGQAKSIVRLMEELEATIRAMRKRS